MMDSQNELVPKFVQQKAKGYEGEKWLHNLKDIIHDLDKDGTYISKKHLKGDRKLLWLKLQPKMEIMPF
jgi:hypothetical protein